MKTVRTKATERAPTPAAQVVGFINKFEPSLARLVKSARNVLRKRYPTAIELVYDNYNALAMGYSSTERTSDAIFSLAVYARGLNLYFIYGRHLKDPHKLLQGNGTQGAFIRVDNIEVFDVPEVKALMGEAVSQAEPPLAKTGGGYTIVKSISAKQRPRRPSRPSTASKREH